jgi:hypothetical protein
MENEQGCTLSNSEDISTNGNSHAPPLLIFQMSGDVAGLNLRIITARIIQPIHSGKQPAPRALVSCHAERFTDCRENDLFCILFSRLAIVSIAIAFRQ